MNSFYCFLFGAPKQDSASIPFQSEFGEISRKILQPSVASTCRFIAINQVVGIEEHHKQLFRNSIRCTVHPKVRQLGIHTINKSTHVFAHCGQGIIRGSIQEPIRLKDIRVDFAANILRNGQRVEGITLDPEIYPFSSPNHPFVVWKQKS